MNLVLSYIWFNVVNMVIEFGIFIFNIFIVFIFYKFFKFISVEYFIFLVVSFVFFYRNYRK